MMSFGVLHVAGYQLGGWWGVVAVSAGVTFLLVNLNDLYESLRGKP